METMEVEERPRRMRMASRLHSEEEIQRWRTELKSSAFWEFNIRRQYEAHVRRGIAGNKWSLRTGEADLVSIGHDDEVPEVGEIEGESDGDHGQVPGIESTDDCHVAGTAEVESESHDDDGQVPGELVRESQGGLPPTTTESKISFNWNWTSCLLLNSQSSQSYLSKACQLSTEDDVASALVIDPFIGFTTHKMNPDYKPPGPTKNQQLLEILQEFMDRQDYNLAYQRFVEGRWLENCPDGDSMKAHIFHYLHVFNKNAGFTVDPCYRYIQDGLQGVKITASRKWSKGQKISLLIGSIAELTKGEEERLLVQGKNDFSIMFSNKKKCSQLWLGPGSYINHDCKPNCRFESTGKSTACIIVIRDVSPTEELTIKYGNDFFDDGNKKCQCMTCEIEGKGVFARDENGSIGRDEDNETRYTLRKTEARMKKPREAMKSKGCRGV